MVPNFLIKTLNSWFEKNTIGIHTSATYLDAIITCRYIYHIPTRTYIYNLLSKLGFIDLHFNSNVIGMYKYFYLFIFVISHFCSFSLFSYFTFFAVFFPFGINTLEFLFILHELFGFIFWFSPQASYGFIVLLVGNC